MDSTILKQILQMGTVATEPEIKSKVLVTRLPKHLVLRARDIHEESTLIFNQMQRVLVEINHLSIQREAYDRRHRELWADIAEQCSGVCSDDHYTVENGDVFKVVLADSQGEPEPQPEDIDTLLSSILGRVKGEA